MAGDRLNLDATRSRGLPISGRGAGFFVGQFTGRTGAAPAALRRRGGPQPGSLDGAHRSGRAGGDHQDSPTTLLLYRRTAHPLGATPHFASSPALALGSRVQSRPGSIAKPFHFLPDGTAGADPSTRLPNRLEDPRQVGPRASLAACCSDHLAQHHHHGPPTYPWRGYRTLHSAISIGIKPPTSLSLASHPLSARHGYIPSVDSGLDFITRNLLACGISRVSLCPPPPIEAHPRDYPARANGTVSNANWPPP